MKQKNNEDDLFLNCTDSADSAGLEFLDSYLFDGQHVSQRGLMNFFLFLKCNIFLFIVIN